MMLPKKILIPIAFIICSLSDLSAQIPPPLAATEYVNIISTAVPFLRVTTDSRSGGMANTGIATTPDPAALTLNAAKLAFIPENEPFGISFTYTPWLSNLVPDLYMANIAAYIKLNEKQTIGTGIRYFSLGTLTSTNANGTIIEEIRPSELSADICYARKFGDHFSAGITGKYIYSNLSVYNGSTINNGKPNHGLAGDVTFYYNNIISPKIDYAAGLTVTNMGGKMYYTNSITEDYLPTNLGIGTAVNIHPNSNHTISITSEVNKLLVPTPDTIDTNPMNYIYDFHEYSPIKGMLASFNDAPTGLSEEIDEINFSAGIEYWFKKRFALRSGYFYESPSKGNRQFYTCGLGLRYTSFTLDLAYKLPIEAELFATSQTLSLSLQFILKKGES